MSCYSSSELHSTHYPSLITDYDFFGQKSNLIAN